MTLFPSCNEVTTDSCLASCLRSDSFSALNGESSGLQLLAEKQSAIAPIHKPALLITVRREIVQSRCETGMRSREAPRRT